jgi:Helicase conserved C-terminal domain/SNF2-related domain
MEELRSGIVPGAIVQAREEHWRVRDTRRVARGAFVTLDALETTGPGRELTLLLPFDRIELAHERAPRRRRRQSVLKGALHALSLARPERGLWTAPSAHIDLLPWQLVPALAVLDGVTRLLLADAVGLGKTIQAGLVLAELRARGMVERALVLAPPAIRGSWAEELRGRFDLPVDVLDLPALLDLERTGTVGANPWSRCPVIVSSIDLVKRPEIRLAVESVPLDLLIVDEAHHATPGTDRHAAVEQLARQVPWVVLASATPHSGDAAAYRALLDLGGAGPAPAGRMRVLRRVHGDVRLTPARRTHALRVTPSREELALQHAVLAYVRDLCRSPRATSGVQLLASVLARRATSSPLAAQKTLQRRLEGLTSRAEPIDPSPPLLPWEELEDQECKQPWLLIPGFSDAEAERECLERLVRLAAAAIPAWSKGRRLRRLLSHVREPAIVFSEFRDTLEACHAALEPVAAVSCLHGELDAGERQRRLSAFLEGRARVLLTTDVAGEGLNLQGPSRLMITVEWPWSPLRLEQRIGRVHRLGQIRTVHGIHFTAAGSYEETVVARLLRRAARAAADLSSPPADALARTIAEQVLGLAVAQEPPEEPSPASAPIDPRAQPEADRVALLRRFAALGRPLPPGAAAWAPPRRGTRRSRVVALLEVRRVDSGALRWSELVAVEIALRTAPAHRREWRSVCRQLAVDPRVRQAAIDAAPGSRVEDPWATVRDRLRLLRFARQATNSSALQPSLFDRRALREAQSRSTVRQDWDERQSRLEARLRAGDPPSVATRVVALIPLDEGLS